MPEKRNAPEVANELSHPATTGRRRDRVRYGYAGLAAMIVALIAVFLLLLPWTLTWIGFGWGLVVWWGLSRWYLHSTGPTAYPWLLRAMFSFFWTVFPILTLWLVIDPTTLRH